MRSALLQAVSSLMLQLIKSIEISVFFNIRGIGSQ